MERSHGNVGFMGVGGTVFAITYGLGLAYAGANSFESGSGFVLVPVVGPFIAAAQRDFSCPPLAGSLDPNVIEENARQCQEKSVKEATAVGVLAGIGLGQLLGVALFTTGLLDRERLWVRTDLLTSKSPRTRQILATGGIVTFGGRF